MNIAREGSVAKFYRDGAPKEIREAISDGKKKDILSPTYPYKKALDRDAYAADLAALQIELVKMEAWVRATGQRIAMIFEGRDAAGKGGTIKRLTKNLNPRGARVVALAKPSNAEATQWYFQRYIAHLPSGGEMVMFDRSWYNRGVVEHVFDFCTTAEREIFFRQALPLEEGLVNDGLRVFKFWLNVGRAEQLRRFLDRERDPLKHWKLSQIDVDGLSRWDAYTDAIRETLVRSHSDVVPWTVIRSDDKRRARIAAIRCVLAALNYDEKDPAVVDAPDPLISGGPDIWDA